MPPFEQLIVICLNDRGKPEGIGDWPERGKMYKVKDILRNATMDGSFGYVLDGLNPQGKWDTYRHDRFGEFAILNLN